MKIFMQKGNSGQKKTGKIKFLFLGILVLAGAMLWGCGKAQEEKTKVHVGYFPNVTHPQALVMKADGSLEEALAGQADVEWVSFNAGPAEVEALFAGDIDIGYIGPVPAINANVKSKGEVRIIAGVTQAGAILVKRQGAEISTVGDLAGKKVAVPQFGNTQHLCLLQLLTENGLQPVSDGGTVDVVAVANAVRSVPPLYIKAAKTMGAGQKDLYLKIILPACVPSFIAALKQSWSFAWRALMSGEVMSSTVGLGQTLILGRDMADINQVMLVIIFAGIVIDKCVFTTVEKRVLRKRGLINNAYNAES